MGKSQAETQRDALRTSLTDMTAEQLTLSILDQTVEPIVVCNDHGTVVHASHAACELAGEDLIGKAFDEVFPLVLEEERFLCLSSGCRVLHREPGREWTVLPTFPCGQTIQGLEARFERRDGKSFNLLVSAGPLTRSHDQIAGCVISLTDITQHKRVEEELRSYREHLEELVEARTAALRKTNDRLREEVTQRKKAQKELADSLARTQKAQRTAEAAETRYRLLLESAPDGIVVVDEGGCISLINNQIEKMFGYPQEELIGKPVEILVPEAARGGHAKYRMAYMKDPQTRPMGRGLDLYGRRKDSSTFPVEISLSPSRSEQGLMVTAIIHDITERKRVGDQVHRLNEDLKRRAADLEAANKELEAFSYSVSHDLRAPLRSIDGFSQSILEDCAANLDNQCTDYLYRIRSASQRMAQLIDDMLNLSRVTRQEMHRDTVDLTAMAWSIASELRLGQPDRAVEFVIAPGLRAGGDPMLLRIALQNLLGNAWKFTAHHPVARIEFGATDHDGERVFFVRDDGAGFNMNYAGKLFSPFQRLHTVREFPGTGIGLATVQRIIHRHGGRVWAEGKVESGATFYFTLGAKDAHG